MKVNKLLKSPKLLYFLLVLVILNILYFLQTQNTRSLVILILIGLVTYSIKENWIIVFSVSLVLTNCLFNGKSSFFEGMDNKNSVKVADKSVKVEKDSVKAAQQSDEEAQDSVKAADEGELDNSIENEEASVEEEETQVIKKIAENIDDEAFSVDDTATLQASYENLQKFLDSPGFNKLTDETHKLAKSQDKLMKSLATLTPVLNDAKASIGNLDLSSYGSLSDIIMNLGKNSK